MAVGGRGVLTANMPGDGPVLAFGNQSAPRKLWNPIAQGRAESSVTALAVLLFVRHETANEVGNFIGRGIQREVPRLHEVNLCLRNITAVRLGFRQRKR